MKYLVHCNSKQTDAERLALALRGKEREVTVYVIGVEDHIALASILMGDNRVDAVKIAPHVRFIETIGVPDGVVNEAKLIALAQKRVAELEAKQNESV